MESPMQETVYTSSSDDSHVMSEKVQSLASNIYQELERMIERYDEDVVKQLMPLVVNVLESLDSAVMDNQEHEVELELLRDDNEQLCTQYEREKQLRKTSEQKLMEIEYSIDGDRCELLSKVESLESLVRMLELKAKNAGDHAARLEERESEMKKDYSTLHERYTELFKTHMDSMERRILCGPEKFDSINSKPRSLNFSHLKSDVLSPNTTQELSANTPLSPLDQPSGFSANQSSDSNTSLKSELQDVSYSTSAVSPRHPHGRVRNKEKSTVEKGQLTDQVAQSDRSTGMRDGWVEDLDANLNNDAFITTPELDEVEELDGFSFNLENTSLKKEKRRANTLYQELSFQDNDALGEMDEGADITGGYVQPEEYASSESDYDSERDPKATDNFFGMGKEVENLISENNELLATKNALNVVKDDLIAKLDELTSEHEILREELKQHINLKERLRQKVAELEEELKKVKDDADKSKAGKSDDEEELPLAQRKRFTRVEMARVLMERNQYKERLIELQEAVRWTEMIRASRSDSSLDTRKNKSSIWKFFSNLFNANEKPIRKATPYVNVHYNAPTSNASPALETMRRKRLGERHRGLDILDSEVVSEKIQQQRARERREQYKQVRAHVKKDDGRLQAYGWSLPTKFANTTKNPEPISSAKSNSSVPVPVPVYCRPLLEKETGMKVWCSAGVNLTGGTPEQAESETSVVGSSSFYISSPHVNEVDKLDKELQDDAMAQKDVSEVEQNLSSMVWLCTSTHSSSQVTVIDANNPAELLDTFHVCSSHLLSISSVPGSKSSDYSVNDNFLKLGKRALSEESNNHTSDKSESHKDLADSKLGDILFVTESAGDVDIQNKGKGIESPTISHPLEPDSDLKYIAEDLNQISSSYRQNSESNDSEPEIVSGREAILLQEEFLSSKKTRDAGEKMSSVLPTMWLGSQAGQIYLHSSVAQWWRCIDSVKLRDAVLTIVHIRGRVFAGLADGTVAIFHRAPDCQWNLRNFHLLDLGHPNHAVRCMTIVNKDIWCGYRNCIHVVDSESISIIESFDAHPRKESQVRQMSWIGEGVWITIRLDSTLRLYHARTRQHLQDVDIEPYVSKMLGTGKLGFSFVRITALLIACKRLWMGTGNGVIISVPLSEGKKQVASDSARAPGSIVRVYTDEKSSSSSSFVPYCSMAQAQLSFHGHRDAVKFFVAVPGVASMNKVAPNLDEKALSSEMKKIIAEEKCQSTKCDSMLVLSGGEGYIDFRIGDGEDEETMAPLPIEDEQRPNLLSSKGERSHLIVWQMTLTE